ncbi:class III extradiol ring-cleavage dioxygenase [Bacillus sp. DX1.1]|uniref:DODA-type extradiol aromatic ring-opening family dioxygenase n=1 Tax=unclassified Bacillus (in: firmicutes) TaxID=185979 RepID=UPI0025711EC8|nr:MULTISPECIES: class III extradiol ring-cleavage dioxygenase [unclassified Bacillus (in: firmicutes)]MDM5154392.1 class III extradiol ring-cleavage dioxygenase [Bacillus sp. DX1.1]WJE83298.1 class III extradiol ring-cleavage dioxygenase [Bacillus sp. DX3.1]
MMPSLFLAHGSPMLAIQDTDYTQFLKTLGETYQPKAIVIFTAHWESEVLTISFSDDEYETIYDFGGFPPELYEIKYTAKGSSTIASMLAEKFKNKGIPVQRDTTRGLDHGSWTLLHRMYPKADIPVIQISVNPFLPAKEQYEIGKAIQGLGQEDILVIGSGVTVHNLRMLKWEQTTPESWAVEFDEWLIEHIQKNNKEALLNWEIDAPHARLAVPRAEHFVPLFIAMGSGASEGKMIHRSYELGTLSYLCFQF